MAETDFDHFPKDFAWGVATASYQIEGGYKDDGKGESIWDVFSHQPGNVSDGSNGDVACDSYHQWDRDVRLCKELGVNYYRFSLSWSRILPQGTPDKINQKGIEYYNNLINGLQGEGIEPMITLYHWDLPQALQDQGGWLDQNKMVQWFTDYAKVCFQYFGDRVKYWITLNEPFVFSLFGYGSGTHAPGVKDVGVSSYIVGHVALLAHAGAYHLYQKEFKSSQKGVIGISLSSDWTEPHDVKNPSDRDAAERCMQLSLGWLAHPIFGDGDYPQSMKDLVAAKSKAEGRESSRLPAFTPEQVKQVKGSADFFGLNNYTTRYARNKISLPDEKPDPFELIPDADVEQISDPAWETAASHWLKIVPWGLRKLLVWIKDNYNNPPVYITENGCSDSGETLHDEQRVQFYNSYLKEVLKAIHEHGCDVKGYFAWSLLDNFEWASGYTEKFGLYHVDFADSKRTCTAKDSTKAYSKIIKENGFAESK